MTDYLRNIKSDKEIKHEKKEKEQIENILNAQREELISVILKYTVVWRAF